MEDLYTFLFLWVIYLILGVVGSFPFWYFGYKRFQWNYYDLLILVLLFLFWATCTYFSGVGKTLGNLGEPIWLGFLLPIAPFLRIIYVNKFNQKYFAKLLLVCYCLIAIAFWAFIPGLPE